MFSLAWTQLAAVIALAGLAIHVAYRLYRLPAEIAYISRVNPENLLFGFIALALWTLGVVGVVFLAGNELFGWAMPKVFGVFARSQCAFFAVVWGAKALSRHTNSSGDLLRRFASALVAIAWVCGLVLCIKWYGYAITDGSSVPCPIFVLQILMGLTIGSRFAQESRPGGILSSFATAGSTPATTR